MFTTKIKFKSINKFPPSKIGDSERVTDFDRGLADPRNIIVLIMSIEDFQH